MAVPCVKNHHGRTYFDEFMPTCLRGAVFFETQCRGRHCKPVVSNHISTSRSNEREKQLYYCNQYNMYFNVSVSSRTYRHLFLVSSRSRASLFRVLPFLSIGITALLSDIYHLWRDWCQWYGDWLRCELFCRFSRGNRDEVRMIVCYCQNCSQPAALTSVDVNVHAVWLSVWC